MRLVRFGIYLKKWEYNVPLTRYPIKTMMTTRNQKSRETTQDNISVSTLTLAMAQYKICISRLGYLLVDIRTGSDKIDKRLNSPQG